MHRLRHPIRSITEPYGKAGLLVAILALVLATTGAAFAAAGLNGKQKKEVTAIAKKFAGKPGPAGATGPAGTNGTNGTNGEKGAKGDPGENGKSVEVTPIAAQSGKCEERAGAEVKQEGAASGTEVCEGSPWTAGGTLPSEKTETGMWSLSEPSGVTCPVESCSGVEAHLTTTISFPIPLPQTSPPKEALLDASHVVYIGWEEYEAGVPTGESTTTHEHCPSTVIGNPEPLIEPKAAPGYLCVYEGVPGAAVVGVENEGSSPHVKANAHIKTPITGEIGVAGAGAVGALLELRPTGTGKHYASGVWAVTAP